MGRVGRVLARLKVSGLSVVSMSVLLLVFGKFIGILLLKRSPQYLWDERRTFYHAPL